MELTLSAHESSKDVFWSGVHVLRASIESMKLSRRKKLRDRESKKVIQMAKAKIANIIEYTLREKQLVPHRATIETVVESEFFNNPIYFELQKKEEPTPAEVREAEKSFVSFLEGRRVSNPEVRLWIAGLVNTVISRTTVA